ncbi:FAD-binding oxidoreductase [Peribacillus cavernae]|uniref:FAD-binding oxidoreductase n=2 Tax=Peribacillus cavernae TaxID=1674310 RepID=A0A3S0VEP7_9BACI|nr:FAD-binding oxidoreductase [Peribacillus cavernae]
MIEGESENHLLGNSGQVTIYPKSEEEIANVLKYANNHRKKITVSAGETKRGFGGIIDSADILLSLANYKGIVEHTPGDMTLTVKAGTPFKELQDYLAEHKQKVSLDPAWPEYATIGGIIASNESGPKRLGYGAGRDVVIGLRMVYPDGTIIRSGGKVVKNVAGYDMNKLFIGSMGTLGVVTEVTMKLRPLAKYESLVLLSFPEGNVEEIRSFAIHLLDSVMEPTALELLSPALSQKLIGENLHTLAIGFEDVESSVHYQEEYVKKIQPANSKMKILQQKEAQAFWDKIYSIGPNGAAPAAGSEIEASLKIGVTNLDVLHVINISQQLKDTHNVVVEAHGGIGHGLCQVNLKGASEDIESAIDQLRNSVNQLGGYVIVKHLPLSLRKKINIWGENPSYFFLLEGIKSKIDPNSVLNHKRYVGGI